MKKLFVLLAGALMVASVAWAADEEIKELDANKLPPITKSILKSYFPGTEVVKTTKSKSKVRNSSTRTASGSASTAVESLCLKPW